MLINILPCSAWAANPYALGKVTFFEQEEQGANPNAKAAVIDDPQWQHMPSVVKDLLLEPTTDHAAKYLQWQDERLNQIKAAAEILESMKRRKK